MGGQAGVFVAPLLALHKQMPLTPYCLMDRCISEDVSEDVFEGASGGR